MLDDPYCLDQFRTWLANWQVRAEGAVVDGVGVAAAEGARAPRAVRGRVESRWPRGGSPVFRAIADSGVAEILGGPAAHPFLPLLDERMALGALESGLEDATRPARPAAPRDLGARVRLPAGSRAALRARRGHPLPRRRPDRRRRDRRGVRRRRLRRRRLPAATWSSATASGPRRPATRAAPGTATSTPSTIRPASSRPG